ncbi:MAG: DUF364 domain-containing protein [Saprospiraceae bacterium]|nr:DUF364 domain-containing protein [Saprospiraceae bacterium]MBK8878391.1 DUF364 domain-containing protein [Haliscomenobacter sp.]
MMEPESIIRQTYYLLQTEYADMMDQLAFADVRIGPNLTAVCLSDGSYGVASTSTDPHFHSAKDKRDFGPFTPTQIKGQKLQALFETETASQLKNTLKLAALNALSGRLLSSGKYRVLEHTDPIDLIQIKPDMHIAMVGAFQSYIRKISETQARLTVLELDENALGESQKAFFAPAAEYPRVIPEADVVIITGLTLVNNTLSGLLSAVAPGTKVIVTGPSSSLIPDVLFANKVCYIGAVRVTNGPRLMEVAGEGGEGYHLFTYCADKICIVKNGGQ